MAEMPSGALERTLYLRSLPAFDGLRSTELAVIAQLMRERRCARGTVLYEQDEPHHTLHLIVDGVVRNERDGELVYREKAPTPAGINGLLGGPTASLHGVAETDLSMLEIDGAALLDVLEDQFDVFLNLRRLFAQRVVALQRELGAFRVPLPGLVAQLPCFEGELGIVERMLCLRRTGVLGDIPINALAQLIRGQQDLELKKGETLWNAGDPGAFLLLLTRGEVVVAPDEPKAKFTATPGFVLGADAAFGGVDYAYKAVVAKDIRAIRIDTSILTDVIEDHFEVGLSTLAHFAREEIRLIEQKARAGLAVPSRSLNDPPVPVSSGNGA